MSMKAQSARANTMPSVLHEKKPKNERQGKVYTPEQLAEQWGMSRHTVLTYLRTGKLKGVKIGRSWRIREHDLKAFIQEDTLVHKQRPWS
jgi:excisionase family DNA binding protein